MLSGVFRRHYAGTYDYMDGICFLVVANSIDCANDNLSTYDPNVFISGYKGVF
ncbi:hypothetical protein ANAPH1_00943 [Anaplasma phagocytophilum]|nr:hypothetical protein ANAPH1_00943 [Anaplasma phagocytophilum]